MREEISWREYFSLRPPDLKKPEYKHLWLLLYWPLELAFFTAAGRLPRSYHPVACALDASIPLLEGFVVPYLLWFLCGLFLLLYTLRRNIPVFRRFMDFMIVTILLCGAVFLLLADLLSRTVLSPREIPIGVVTSFVGSIVFIWIYYRSRKRGE